jgi:hypothetical protein
VMVCVLVLTKRQTHCVVHGAGEDINQVHFDILCQGSFLAYSPAPKCYFLIKIDPMHSLIAYFQFYQKVTP